MALPTPLSDNPLRWDGWKLYASTNPYERLCLEFADTPPTAAQIESNCRELLMWWQKKLPLKNQPSNPLAQLLRSGMDEAPAKLAEARTLLLDPESRAQIDAELHAAQKAAVVAEFHKFLIFVLTSGELDPGEEENLYVVGGNLGLGLNEMKCLVEEELVKSGIKRGFHPPFPEEAPRDPTVLHGVFPAAGVSDPRLEFLRMLRLSMLEEITDDQRDAFCNMGETLGLSGGDAEDIIDEYLEEQMQKSIPARPAPPLPPKKPALVVPARPIADAPAPSPQQRAEEKKAFPNFISPTEIALMLVPSGVLIMGSDEPDAAPNERPPTKTRISAFYLSRWPITNAQYELFDPAHRAKRAARAGDNHPVIYVTHPEAARFCAWLSQREKRPYRLPTEAEWEYAARGMDGRKFPWGNRLDANDLANFADTNKKLPWAEHTIDCGFAETSPVGSFPRGISPFGMEDMAGNVWEWCLDCLTPYPGRERTNPRGPLDGLKQIYRGGSWKSRASSLRTSARASNSPAYSANDVGFRVLCECGK